MHEEKNNPHFRVNGNGMIAIGLENFQNQRCGWKNRQTLTLAKEVTHKRVRRPTRCLITKLTYERYLFYARHMFAHMNAHIIWSHRKRNPRDTNDSCVFSCSIVWVNVSGDHQRQKCIRHTPKRITRTHHVCLSRFVNLFVGRCTSK